MSLVVRVPACARVCVRVSVYMPPYPGAHLREMTAEEPADTALLGCAGGEEGIALAQSASDLIFNPLKSRHFWNVFSKF